MKNNNKMPKGCLEVFLGVIISLVLLFGAIFLWGGDSDEYDSSFVEPSITPFQTESIEPTSKPKKQTQKQKFVSKMKKHVGKKQAKKVYSIYKKKIGFKEIEYEKKQGDLDNYVIIADGFKTCCTCSFSYVRIFIPNTDNVFYEDGNVLLTYKEFKKTVFEPYETTTYDIIAEEIVRPCLKTPDDADFSSSEETLYRKYDKLIAVQGYVDSYNSFGAKIRTNYTVQFTIIDYDAIQYETHYVKIGDTSEGQFKEFKR